ncbi:hypothetical protein MP638_004320 [Amoeboaphelidium occidentale]|nr:hypothetical protein MP638_004320 [Amoeboaphelidium occidentale]
MSSQDEDFDELVRNLSLIEISQLPNDKKIKALETKLKQHQQDLELAELRAELERQRTEELEELGFVGKILQAGFPALETCCLDSKPSQSQAKTVGFTLHEKEVQLPIFDDMQLKKDISMVWKTSRKWDNETSIRTMVQLAIDDCINAACVSKNLRTTQEVTFVSVNAKKIDRTDLALVRDAVTSVIIGAIEVKKPPIEKQRGIHEFDMDNAGQLVQYMYDIRSNFGVRFVFGILTTYEKWRFFWFEDSDEAMLCDSLDSFVDLCTKSPPSTPIDTSTNDKSSTAGYAVIPSDTVVRKSLAYDYNDKSLVYTLCTLLLKWINIPCDRVHGFLRPNRLYQVGEQNWKKYSFRKLPSNLESFTYEFPPHGNTNTFYFLHVYQKTGDGKVALWSTGSGRIGVAKFFINKDIHKQALMAQNEQERWREFWEVETFVLRMFGLHVLMMPFVFHVRRYSNELRFCPMARWNFRSRFEGDIITSPFSPSQLKEDSELEEHESKVLLENPLKVAELALRRMVVDCGWKQDDEEVKREHIGLLPTNTKDGWTLEPVMIDLTRVRKIEKENRRDIFIRHLKILQDLMPLKQSN